MNNLTRRSLTALAFAIILIASISISKYTFGALFLLISILGILEFCKLSKKTDVLPQSFISVLTGVSMFIISFLVADNYLSPKYFILLIPLIFSVFIVELYRKKTQPFGNIAYTILSLIYIALPLSLLNFMVMQSGENKSDVIFTPQILLGFLYLMWASDTGAYISGSLLGKHKLFERISPKKTWEGSIGGGIITIGTAYVISIFYTELSFMDWAIIALINVVIGTLGDLTESMLKRSINIKDSGNILPGHGGILDRFDSLLIAAPIVYVYLCFFVFNT